MAVLQVDAGQANRNLASTLSQAKRIDTALSKRWSLNIDTSGASRALSIPLDHLRNIESAASKAQKAMGSIKAPDMGGGGESGGADMGKSSAAAIASALAPLSSIGGKIVGQLDKIGGTFITLARRIDAAMKFPAFDTFLTKVKDKLPDGFAKSAASAIQSLARLNNYMSSIGDVAKRGLGPVTKFAGSITGITPAAKAATGGMKSLGREIAATLGIFSAAGAVTAFFTVGIRGAVSLNETVSKTHQVFGDATGAITSQADEMAKRFGLVKGPMLDAASSFGLIGKGAGYSDQAAAKLATTMVTLGADFSSFHNIPMAEAFEKIRSGLAGQSEPLRQYGAGFSEADVQQEALRLGLAKTTKAIDETAKITARASLIQQKMVLSVGDLEATAGGAANQFRKAEGGLANFATSMGTLLLPAVTTGITGFNDLLASVIEFAEANKTAIEGFAAKVKAGFEFAGSILRNFNLYWDIVKLKAKECIANVTSFFETIPINLGIIGTWIGTTFVGLVGDGINAVGALFSNLGKNVASFAGAIKDYLQNPLKGFQFDFTPLLDGFRATAIQLPELVKAPLISMQAEIDAKAREIADKEAKRASDLADMIAPRARNRPNFLIPPEKPDNTKDHPMFAAALEGRSKEAYSAIVQAKGRQRGEGGDDIKTVAKNSAQQVQIAKDQLTATKAVQGAIASLAGDYGPALAF